MSKSVAETSSLKTTATTTFSSFEEFMKSNEIEIPPSVKDKMKSVYIHNLHDFIDHFIKKTEDLTVKLESFKIAIYILAFATCSLTLCLVFVSFKCIKYKRKLETFKKE